MGRVVDVKSGVISIGVVLKVVSLGMSVDGVGFLVLR